MANLLGTTTEDRRPGGPWPVAVLRPRGPRQALTAVIAPCQVTGSCVCPPRLGPRLGTRPHWCPSSQTRTRPPTGSVVPMWENNGQRARIVPRWGLAVTLPAHLLKGAVVCSSRFPSGAIPGIPALSDSAT